MQVTTGLLPMQAKQAADQALTPTKAVAQLGTSPAVELALSEDTALTWTGMGYPGMLKVLPAAAALCLGERQRGGWVCVCRAGMRQPGKRPSSAPLWHRRISNPAFQGTTSPTSSRCLAASKRASHPDPLHILVHVCLAAIPPQQPRQAGHAPGMASALRLELERYAGTQRLKLYINGVLYQLKTQDTDMSTQHAIACRASSSVSDAPFAGAAVTPTSRRHTSDGHVRPPPPPPRLVI